MKDENGADFGCHFENGANFEFFSCNLWLFDIIKHKIYEPHVKIDWKIRNMLTFLDFGCHFENGGHFEIFGAKYKIDDVPKN